MSAPKRLTPQEAVENVVMRHGWSFRAMPAVPTDPAYLAIDVGQIRLTARGENLEECWSKMAEYLRATHVIPTGLFCSTESEPDMVGDGRLNGLATTHGKI